MDRQVMRDITNRSLQGTITFDEIVMKLLAIGVESYLVDLVRMEKIYYMRNGQSHHEIFDYKGPKIAQDFLSSDVVKAIRASQNREINYVEFLNLVSRAGTTQYIVFIAGRKVIYYGRNGDFHIENFQK